MRIDGSMVVIMGYKGIKPFPMNNIENFRMFLKGINIT